LTLALTPFLAVNGDVDFDPILDLDRCGGPESSTESCVSACAVDDAVDVYVAVRRPRPSTFMSRSKLRLR
jgi:hypothetical protein